MLGHTENKVTRGKKTFSYEINILWPCRLQGLMDIGV